jgi:hypothetical protein
MRLKESPDDLVGVQLAAHPAYHPIGQVRFASGPGVPAAAYLIEQYFSVTYAMSYVPDEAGPIVGHRIDH